MSAARTTFSGKRCATDEPLRLALYVVSSHKVRFESNFSAIGDRTLSNSKAAAVSNCRRRGDADASNSFVDTAERYYGVGAEEGAFIPPRMSGMFISLKSAGTANSASLSASCLMELSVVVISLPPALITVFTGTPVKSR